MSNASLNGLNINIFDEIYVQTAKRVPFNTEDPPLAFATQTGTGFGKRKEIVDTWSRQCDYKAPMTEGATLQNVPQYGFTFEKSVSRWTTSNKWFTINDPRGFQLQITADNLGHILINAGVLKGELQGEYVWARNKSNIFLCRTTHSSYIDKIQPKIARTNLIPGDIILMGQETTEYQFLGTFYATRMGTEYRYVEQSTGKIMPSAPASSPRFYSYSRQSNPYKNTAITFSAQDDKPVYVFKDSFRLKVMRSKPTKVKILRTETPFCLKVGQPYVIYSSLPASNVALFWDSVKEMQEHGPAFIEAHGETYKSAVTLGGYHYERTAGRYGGDINYDLANNKV